MSGLGVLVGLAILLPAEMVNVPLVAAGAGPSCQGWNSITRPPDYIRVLRNSSGRVERVPFRKYVITVMGKEWPGYLPQAVIDAGAVAVKQYAWFHTLGNGRVSRQGQCFDVTDGVGDQLYKPNRARVRQDHYTAVDATWGVRLLKNGSLFMTGYRTGNKGACGHDANGWKLYARSAVRCAERGMGFEEILRTYYGPVSVVSGGASVPSGAAFPDSAAATVASPAVAAQSTAPATPATTTAITPEAGQSGGVSLDVDVPSAPTAPSAPTGPIGQLAFMAG